MSRKSMSLVCVTCHFILPLRLKLSNHLFVSQGTNHLWLYLKHFPSTPALFIKARESKPISTLPWFKTSSRSPNLTSLFKPFHRLTLAEILASRLSSSYNSSTSSLSKDDHPKNQKEEKPFYYGGIKNQQQQQGTTSHGGDELKKQAAGKKTGGKRKHSFVLYDRHQEADPWYYTLPPCGGPMEWAPKQPSLMSVLVRRAWH